MSIDSGRSLHVPSPLSGLLEKLDDVRDDELTPELPDEEVQLDKEQEEMAAEFVQEAVEVSLLQSRKQREEQGRLKISTDSTVSIFPSLGQKAI